MATLADSVLPSKILYVVGNENPNRRAKLLNRILDGGATTTNTRPPLPDDQHLLYDDTVYRLSKTITEKTPATRYSVKVDIAEETVNESTAIHFSELPKVDRETFAEHGLAGGDIVGIGTTFLYTDTERAKSVLVPSPNYSYIVWKNGSRAEWVVDDANETTLNTYSYTAESVATASEYGRRIRKRFAFELSNLSDGQRNIVTTAIEENGHVVGPNERPTTALLSLTDRFRNHEQARGLDEEGEGDLSGQYLVRYENEVYWTTLLVAGNAFRIDAPS
jgi:hypothetical protein